MSAREPEPEQAPIPVPVGPSAARRTHPLFGKTVARCTVGDRIGRGATSSVFRARYQPLDKDIALKILSGDRALDPEMRARFLGEAKAIARLDHENIVRVLDVVEDRGNLCILMEHVDGETVQDLLDDQGALPVKDALRIALDVARALEAAHAEDIVHRDIKPANFIYDRKTRHVKVVDFGLAAKHANNRVGTPLYMSPEAAQGKRIDDRSDVYALGVSLYQMLTGKHPFTGATVKDILAAQVNQTAVPPSRAKRDVGNKYDDLLAKMLVKAKGYRPSAADVVDLLEPLVGEPHREGGKGRKRPARRGAKRESQTPLLLAGGAVVVIAIVAVAFLSQGGGDGGTGPAQPVPVAGGGTPGAGGTPGGIATPPPPADPEAAPRAAYEEAETWASANEADPEGRARRWADVERRFAASPWGKKAGEKRVLAEQAAEKLRKAEEEAAREKQAREALEAERRKIHEAIPLLVAAWDFETAAARVNRVGPPEGTSVREWTKKSSRLEYLGKQFLPRLDGALKGGPARATAVKPSAGADEMIVGADRTGLVTEGGGRSGKIPWPEVKGDAFYKGVARKVLSQKDPHDQLWLAVLATELGLAKEAKDAREFVKMLDAVGEATEELKRLFAED